jgi:hypothetical protein
MMPSTTTVFVKTFKNRCSIMGLNQGAMGITKFPNQQGDTIDIDKNYVQKDEPTLKAHCNKFCKATGAKFEMRATRNNHMMVQCLKKSLTTASLACLKPYQVQYMFEGVEYGPLMYKITMRLVTIDSITTTKTLHANLNNLPSYAASVNGNVDLINSYFDTNYTQILAKGATGDDPIAKLFDAYLSVPDYNFKQYISKKQADYHNRDLGASFTHENLMAHATAKFTYLKVHQICCAKSQDKEKLIAMIVNLKGKLKLAPNLEKRRRRRTTRPRTRMTRGPPEEETRRRRRTRRTLPTRRIKRRKRPERGYPPRKARPKRR